ncbi:MAG: hypothetical protein AAF727_07465 [Pseudomonadota bacterium]
MANQKPTTAALVIPFTGPLARATNDGYTPSTVKLRTTDADAIAHHVATQIKELKQAADALERIAYDLAGNIEAETVSEILGTSATLTKIVQKLEK